MGTTSGLPAVVRLRFSEVLYSAYQPPSEARMAPLTTEPVPASSISGTTERVIPLAREKRLK